MSLNTSYITPNPRLGTGFGIFTSTFASLVVLLIILEQLGLARSLISQLIIVLPIVFYAAIGLYVRTTVVEDYFIAGQRVPPLYNGLALSANVVSGAGLLGLTGCFFFIGYDALPIALGWCAGLGLMSILLAPYLRKMGAYTLPGFFSIRFSSRICRVVTALLLIPPVLMLLVAELHIGRSVASIFLRSDPDFILQIGCLLLAVTVIFGGMRALTWTQCAQFIVVILSISVPLIAVSILVTNLPLPQLSFGTIIQQLAEMEAQRGVAPAFVQPLGDVLPGDDATQLNKPFGVMLESLGAGDFIALTLCFMLGAAVLPTQIPRMSTTPSVSSVRKSIGWAAIFVGFIVLTIPAFAAFTKFQVALDLLGIPASQIPDSGAVLSQLGLLEISPNSLDPALGNAEIAFYRDYVALMLPVLNDFPFVLIGLIGAAALAAVMAAAGGQLVTLANVIANDFYHPFHQTASPARRLLVARLGLIAIIIAAYLLTTQTEFDPLRLLIQAFSVSAGTFFAPLILAIWWKGLTQFGAICGMVVGLAVTALQFTVSPGVAILGVDPLTAGMLGVPLSLLAAIGGSMVSPKPSDETLEIVNEIGIPSGETVHARLTRLAARGKALKP
ncbi:MAG: VC_2705 family sodium/solute symporter [Hyphomicrobiales bacterium]|nr:VC_2705 family sodium/solute symporter [Hyphomicrobiales bacterium]